MVELGFVDRGERRVVRGFALLLKVAQRIRMLLVEPSGLDEMEAEERVCGRVPPGLETLSQEHRTYGVKERVVEAPERLVPYPHLGQRARGEEKPLGEGPGLSCIGETILVCQISMP